MDGSSCDTGKFVQGCSAIEWGRSSYRTPGGGVLGAPVWGVSFMTTMDLGAGASSVDLSRWAAGFARGHAAQRKFVGVIADAIIIFIAAIAAHTARFEFMESAASSFRSG